MKAIGCNQGDVCKLRPRIPGKCSGVAPQAAPDQSDQEVREVKDLPLTPRDKQPIPPHEVKKKGQASSYQDQEEV
eukprot:924218-Amphidinium_carterae.1